MKKEKIETPLVSIPRKGISQAVKYGDTLFVSGQVGKTVDGVVPEGIEAQVEVAITNTKHILEAAGSSLDQVLMCRCFLQNLDDFEGMNRAYFKFFGDDEVGPARYTMVASPVSKDLLFEIAVFAAV